MTRQASRRMRRQSLNKSVLLLLIVAALFAGARYMLSQH